MEDSLSLFTKLVNQQTTHSLTYTMKNMSNEYEIEELPEGTFNIYFRLTSLYQYKYPIIKRKLKCKNTKQVIIVEAVILSNL